MMLQLRATIEGNREDQGLYSQWNHVMSRILELERIYADKVTEIEVIKISEGKP
jgi:hypothetical protein